MSAKEWLQHVLSLYDGVFVSGDDTTAAGGNDNLSFIHHIIQLFILCQSLYILRFHIQLMIHHNQILEIMSNPEANKFTLKIRDEALPKSIEFLRSKGLFPTKDESSDDDACYGDDFFETM